MNSKDHSAHKLLLKADSTEALLVACELVRKVNAIGKNCKQNDPFCGLEHKVRKDLKNKE